MRSRGWLAGATVLVVATLVAAASGCGSSDGSSSATTAASKEAAGLGVTGEDVNANFRLVSKGLRGPTPARGVAVFSLAPGSPLQAAGIVDASAHQNAVQDSDVIETIDGKPVTAFELRNPLPGTKPGQVITLHVWSVDGTQRDVRVRIKAMPPSPKGGGYFPGG